MYLQLADDVKGQVFAEYWTDGSLWESMGNEFFNRSPIMFNVNCELVPFEGRVALIWLDDLKEECFRGYSFIKIHKPMPAGSSIYFRRGAITFFFKSTSEKKNVARVS